MAQNFHILCQKNIIMGNFKTIVLSILVFGLFISTTNKSKNEKIIEEELIFEEWMAKPFIFEDGDVVEKPLEVEKWMTKPFI